MVWYGIVGYYLNISIICIKHWIHRIESDLLHNMNASVLPLGSDKWHPCRQASRYMNRYRSTWQKQQTAKASLCISATHYKCINAELVQMSTCTCRLCTV